MAKDKDHKKTGIFGNAYEFFKDHWGELFAAGHIAAAMFNGGKMSENAPKSAQDIHAAMGGNIGGKGNPADEVAYKRIVMRLDGTLRAYLDAWVGFAFPVKHPEKWVCDKARIHFEEWRVIISKMAHDDENMAILYLTEVARSVRRAFFSEMRKIGKTPNTITENELSECKMKALEKISEKMAFEGTPIPNYNETPFMVELNKVMRGTWELISTRAITLNENIPRAVSSLKNRYTKWEMGYAARHDERVNKLPKFVQFMIKNL